MQYLQYYEEDDVSKCNLVDPLIHFRGIYSIGGFFKEFNDLKIKIVSNN